MNHLTLAYALSLSDATSAYFDVVLLGGHGTHFGDKSDKEDNGIGAGGFRVRANPTFLGVALPRYAASKKTFLSDSPLGRMPLRNRDGSVPGALIIVSHRPTGISAECRHVDVGPRGDLVVGEGRMVDLMLSVVHALEMPVTGEYPDLEVRIVEGQQWLPPAVQGLMQDRFPDPVGWDEARASLHVESGV